MSRSSTPGNRRARPGVAKYTAYNPGKNGAFPSYATSNLNGNIRRNREHLARLLKGWRTRDSVGRMG